MGIVDNGHPFDQPVVVELKHVDTLEARRGTVFQPPIVDEVTCCTWGSRCTDADIDWRYLALPGCCTDLCEKRRRLHPAKKRREDLCAWREKRTNRVDIAALQFLEIGANLPRV